MLRTRPYDLRYLMQPLSVTQEKVYQKIVDHNRRHGLLPEPSQLARELGIHYVSLKQHLEALARKGYIRFESRGRGRSPIFELPASATGVPVLGDIPAGPLSDAAPFAEGFLPLHGLARAHFALRVSGNSMADLIQDGDVVLFEKRQPYRSGEICAVRVDENDVTLKYVDDLGKREFALRPHNPAHPTVKVTAEEAVIARVYLGLQRGAVRYAILETE